MSLYLKKITVFDSISPIKPGKARESADKTSKHYFNLANIFSFEQSYTLKCRISELVVKLQSANFAEVNDLLVKLIEMDFLGLEKDI